MNEQVNYAKIQRIQDNLEALTIGTFGTGFVTDAMMYESGIKATVAQHTSDLADMAILPQGIKTITEDPNFDNSNIINTLLANNVKVKLPKGTYKCNLTITNITNIEGNGIDSTILLPFDTAKPVVKIGDDSTANQLQFWGKFKNLTVDGNNTSSGILLQNAHGGEIDVKIQKTIGYGIKLFYAWINEIKVKINNFADYGVIFGDASTSSKLYSPFIWQSVAGTAIKYEGSVGSAETLILGGTIEDVYRGFEIESSDLITGVQLSNVHFERITEHFKIAMEVGSIKPKNISLIGCGFALTGSSAVLIDNVSSLAMVNNFFNIGVTYGVGIDSLFLFGNKYGSTKTINVVNNYIDLDTSSAKLYSLEVIEQIVLANNKSIKLKDSTGVAQNALWLNGSNALAIGGGSNIQGISFRILGSTKSEINSNGEYQNDVAGKGIILKTPDGTKFYRITVNDSGVITSTLV